MAKASRDSEVRSRIIEAARRLVAVQGVHSSTMRGIAHEAGVSTGAVTHYFTDKAEVMDAVLKLNYHVAAARIADAVAGLRGIAALKATVEALVPTDEESLRIWTVVIAFWGHRPAQSLLAAGIEQGADRGLRAVLVKSLRDAVSDGELPADADVEGEAERLLVLIAGLGFMAGGFEEEVDHVRARTRTMLTKHLAELTAVRERLHPE